MAKIWKEVVRLYFKGPGYEDHALDLTALRKLSHFQKLVEDTAKALWRRDNPDRERLPAHFDSSTRLYIRTIEEGSVVIPLEVNYEEEQQNIPFAEDISEVEKAIDMAQEVFDAMENKQPLPEYFPQGLISDYLGWGNEITENEEIQLEPVTLKKRKVNITKKSFDYLAEFSERHYEDQVSIKGEVLEADVKQKKFQLWIDDKTKIQINFSDEQEIAVTTALKEHNELIMEVQGIGEFFPNGKVKSILKVDNLQVIPKEELAYDESVDSIGDILDRLASEIPSSEWEKLPKDLAENLDHYLYGKSKS